MKNIIQCEQCKIPYKPLTVSNNEYGKFICPKCYNTITIHAPVELIKTFT